MAIAGSSRSLARLVESLGLKHCRSLTLRASIDSCVTLESEQYVQEADLKKFTGEIETNEWVLVPKAEWIEMQVSLARSREAKE